MGVGVAPTCGDDADGVGIEAGESLGAESPIDEGGLILGALRLVAGWSRGGGRWMAWVVL